MIPATRTNVPKYGHSSCKVAFNLTRSPDEVCVLRGLLALLVVVLVDAQAGVRVVGREVVGHRTARDAQGAAD